MRKRILLSGCACVVLIAIATGTLLLHAAASGPVLHTYNLSTAPWAAALDQQSGRLFVVNRGFGFGFVGGSSGPLSGGQPGGGNQDGGTITVLGTESSGSTQTARVGDDPRAVAVDAQHHQVYITNDDDANVSVIDARSGALLHTTQVGTRPHSVVVDGQTNRVFVVNTSDRTVSMLDARTSDVMRLVGVPAAVDFSGAAVDSKTNRAFIVGGGLVSVLDARSGALLQTISIQREGYQRPQGQLTQVAVDEQAGRVYVLGVGVVQVLDAGTGRLLNSIAVDPSASALTVDSQHGRLLVTSTGTNDTTSSSTREGSLQVVDLQTGTIRRTIALGTSPTAVLIDEHAGHVLVVDSGGERRVTDSWWWLPDGIRSRLPFLPAPNTGTRTEPGSVTVLDLSRL